MFICKLFNVNNWTVSTNIRRVNLTIESNQNEEEDEREEIEFSFDKFVEKNGEHNRHHIIGFDIYDFNCFLKF